MPSPGNVLTVWTMHSPLLGCSPHLGFMYKPVLDTLSVSKMGITNASFFFNCFLLLGSRQLETGSPTKQVAASGTSLSLPIRQQHEKMPETNGYLVGCLHRGLQLMCSTMYTAAVMCILCLPCIQECLISQLISFFLLGFTMWQL